MTVIRKALALSLMQRYVAFIIQFISSLVMARLLSPLEIGIYSLAVAAVGIAGMLRDFGVGEYIVQEKDLTHDRLRSALGVTILMALLLATCLYFLAPPLARLYNERGIERVLRLLTINFLMLPLGSMSFAVLTREMDFKAIFWVQTLGGLVSAVVGIWLAYTGFGYMSMAWASIAGICVTVAMLACIRPKEFFLLPKFTGLGRSSRFGGTLTLGRLADQATRKAPDFLIGSGLGMHAVGIQSKVATLGDAFHDFFISAISRVAFPVFAKRIRDQDSGREDYLRGVRTVSVVPLFFFGFLAIFCDPLIYLLFGPQWLEVIPLVRISGIAGLTVAPYFLAPPMLSANGQVNDLLMIQFVGAATFIPLLWLASGISLEAVAIAGAAVTLVRVGLFQRALWRGFKLTAMSLVRATVPGSIAAIAAFASASPALLWYERTNVRAFLVLAGGGLMALLVGCSVLFLLKHPLAAEVAALLHRWFPGTEGARRRRVE